MATVGSLALTFNDLRKRQAPDFTIDRMIECLMQENPIMEDIPWMAGNLPTGNQTTQRTALPEVHLRQINKGVPYGKSATKQVTDTCCLLEAHSFVDEELLGIQEDKVAFRASEDDAFVEAMSEKVAHYLFYGDSDENMDEFNGLAKRYSNYGGEKNSFAYQVINAGGTKDGALSSAYLVGWGGRSVCGIYPKFGYAGLFRRDEGRVQSRDKDGNTFWGYETTFKWKPGLAVLDPRMIAAVRNIDVGALNASSATAADRKAAVENMIKAQNRMRKLQGAGLKLVWYVSDEMYTFLSLYFNDKNNAYITRQEIADGMPAIHVNGILVKKEDALTETEGVIESV